MGGLIKAWFKRAGELSYRASLWVLSPINLHLSRTRRQITHPNSVLHISYMVHIPYYTTRLLRRCGVKADYLAIGNSPVWDRCDFQKRPSRWGPVQAWREFILLWKVVARYEVLHLHFLIGLSESGWELPLLKRMGRKIVVHYRGCDLRTRSQNMALHPGMNLCQECDYHAICEEVPIRRRRALARRFGDYFLVTTPDLKDFAPHAEHLPFFAPEIADGLRPRRKSREGGAFKIVHATNHPGLEGTEQIQSAMERLRQKGYPIHFVSLRGVSPEEVLDQYAEADLAIGKMKMGYYGNAQIESMCLGVPTITYVRPEFMTEDLARSGFIFTTLVNLEGPLEYYLTHPEALEQKRRIARDSILNLHDNAKLARRLIGIYEALKKSSAVTGGA